MKINGFILEEKSSFKMLGMTFFSKLDWNSYIIFIAITVSKKIGALIRSMKFLSPEVALYLYKSSMRPCMEYCCHIWAGATSCYLELLDKLQKRICRTVGTSLAASLEPLFHRRNLPLFHRQSLFYRYYFGRCSTELSELVPLPYSRVRSTPYSDRLHGFSATISRCYKGFYVNSFFPRTARLWKFLPIEFFSLTYDLSGLKYRIRFFLNRFPVYFNLFVLLFLVTPCLVVAVEPCIKGILINKKRLLCWETFWDISDSDSMS